MQPMSATDYGDLQVFLLWGVVWVISILSSVAAFVCSWLNLEHKRWAYGFAFFSLVTTALLALVAWLPSVSWHPNDRAAMLRGVVYTPWLAIASLLVVRVRAAR